MLDSENRRVKGKYNSTILVLIGMAIIAAIVFVYNKGKTKALLGNQPYPAASPRVVKSQTGDRGVTNMSSGGRLVGRTAGTVNITPSSNCLMQCPQCGAQGVPVCSNCGAVMQSHKPAAGLYVCPKCAMVGTPVCPSCRVNMIPVGASPPNNNRGVPTLAAAP